MTLRYDPREGARNLLLNCIGVRPGQRITIAAEDPAEDFYDALAAACIFEVAEELGCQASLLPCPCVSGPESLPQSVIAALTEADHVIFQARAGDQVRFTELSGTASKTMSYALDIGLLGSEFCTLHHGFMREVLEQFEAELNAAKTWRITCPLGTDVMGTQIPASHDGGTVEDFTLLLFPVPIFRPVSCATMNGRVAVAHWLMSTANHVYENSFLRLDRPLMAVIEAGRIVDFEGPKDLSLRVREHYQRVGHLFDIEENVVHSWHAGIHPKALYPLNATSNIERWGSVAFANPRYLHFHTCGNYAPGEIAWSLFDTQVELDGKVYWQTGRFTYLDKPELRSRLAHYDIDDSALAQRFDIGI
ncbi:MAG: hypothetical protein JSV89_06275 [Spirochaetaceae bacterium]|nr:MAG: hypothetical protein JSV89_06275 [Spirochaetaceae bacterium]